MITHPPAPHRSLLPDPRPTIPAPRSGFALLAVLVFVFLLSMVSASLLFQATADEAASHASADSEQAWATVLSGIHEVLRVVPTAGGPELDWQDNPERFKHQLVHDDGAQQWFFSVLAPAPPDSLAPVRFGLCDEASLPQGPGDTSTTLGAVAAAAFVAPDPHPDPDLTLARRPRCRIDDPASPLPPDSLPEGFTNYIAALRASRTLLSHPAAVLDASLTVKDAQGSDVTVPSGITTENLGVVLDLFTSRPAGSHPSLVNVNTASAVALSQVPGIDLPLAESIVSTRTAIAPDRRRTLAWLVQEGTVQPDAFKAIAPHLTARSYHFQCRVAAYALPSGQFRVFEVHIDASAENPKITRLRDVSRHGFPIDFKLLVNEPEAPQASAPRRAIPASPRHHERRHG